MAMALPTTVMAMLLSTMLQLNMSRAAIGRKDMVIKEYLLRPQATQDDFTSMYRSRARFVEWFITENIGHRIAKANNIPLETIEVYRLPSGN